jgi:hypothetical protein
MSASKVAKLAPKLTFNEAKAEAVAEFSAWLTTQFQANYDEAFVEWRKFPFGPLSVDIAISLHEYDIKEKYESALHQIVLDYINLHIQRNNEGVHCDSNRTRDTLFLNYTFN